MPEPLRKSREDFINTFPNKKISEHKIKKSISYKVKSVFVYQPNKKHKLSLLAVFTLIFVFAGCLAVVFSFADVREERTKIAWLNEEIRQQKEIIADLLTEVNRNVDKEKVTDLAINKLGMTLPEHYQEIHIVVPKENYASSGQYSIKTSIETMDTNISILQRLKKFFGGV